MQTRKLIRVTKRDIENGVQGDEFTCPIALALHRLKAFRKPSPFSNCLRVGSDIILYNDIDIAADLPDSAKEFIRLFDAGEPVHPFSFKIEVNP